MEDLDIQRIIDAFSIGKLKHFSAIGEEIPVVDEQIDSLTEKPITYRGALQLYEVTTFHGNFILIKKSGFILRSLNQLSPYLKQYLDLTHFTFLETYGGVECTHKDDMHWYLIQSFKKLNFDDTTQQIKNLINGQEIQLEVGYGGVLYIEIGQPLKPLVTKGRGGVYREMVFFCDEQWEIWHKGQKVTSRFEDETIDQHVNQVNGKQISDFSIQPSYSKTFIEVGEYVVVLKRIEEFVTWYFTHRLHSFEIRLMGQKELRLYDSRFEKPSKKRVKFKREATDFDQFYKEDLRLSGDNVRKLLVNANGAIIEEIRPNTGVEFNLAVKNTDEWLFCINSDWELYKSATLLCSSTSHRFAYEEILTKYLLGRKIISFLFNQDLKESVLTLDNDLKIVVKKGKKYSVWTVFNLSRGYHISALRDTKFTHIILCPDHLLAKYLAPKYGSQLAHALYALDLYREFLL